MGSPSLFYSCKGSTGLTSISYRVECVLVNYKEQLTCLFIRYYSRQNIR